MLNKIKIFGILCSLTTTSYAMDAQEKQEFMKNGRQHAQHLVGMSPQQKVNTLKEFNDFIAFKKALALAESDQKTFPTKKDEESSSESYEEIILKQSQIVPFEVTTIDKEKSIVMHNNIIINQNLKNSRAKIKVVTEKRQ